jgi:hypothetical protein
MKMGRSVLTWGQTVLAALIPIVGAPALALHNSILKCSLAGNCTCARVHRRHSAIAPVITVSSRSLEMT